MSKVIDVLVSSDLLASFERLLKGDPNGRNENALGLTSIVLAAVLVGLARTTYSNAGFSWPQHALAATIILVTFYLIAGSAWLLAGERGQFVSFCSALLTCVIISSLLIVTMMLVWPSIFLFLPDFFALLVETCTESCWWAGPLSEVFNCIVLGAASFGAVFLFRRRQELERMLCTPRHKLLRKVRLTFLCFCSVGSCYFLMMERAGFFDNVMVQVFKIVPAV